MDSALPAQLLYHYGYIFKLPESLSGDQPVLSNGGSLGTGEGWGSA